MNKGLLNEVSCPAVYKGFFKLILLQIFNEIQAAQSSSLGETLNPVEKS